MATLIITEKASQAKDLRAAFGARFGQILPAEGHLLRLAEPEEVNAAWKSWSCVVLKPDGLYPTRPVPRETSRRNSRPSPRRSRPATTSSWRPIATARVN